MQFALAKSRVADYTEHEELGLILRQLPRYWRDKALEEEGRRDKNTFTVKITDLVANEEQTRRVFEETLRVPVEKVVVQRGAILVTVTRKEHLDHVVGLSGRISVGGVRPTFVPVRARWRSEDLFEFIAEELRLKEQSKVLAAGFGESSRRDFGGSQHQRSQSRGTWWRNVSEVEEKKPAEKTSAEVVTKKEEKDWPAGECWTCWKEGQNAKHDWRTCPKNKERMERNRAAWRTTQEGKGAKGEKGGGGSKGKSKGGKGKKGRSHSQPPAGKGGRGAPGGQGKGGKGC